jgi:hypothetical protein
MTCRTDVKEDLIGLRHLAAEREPHRGNGCRDKKKPAKPIHAEAPLRTGFLGRYLFSCFFRETVTGHRSLLITSTLIAVNSPGATALPAE